MQLSFGDRWAPGPELHLQHVRSIDLGDDAWVEYGPDSLRGHQQVLELLLATADWELHRRQMYDRVVEVPRLVAGFPGSKGFVVPTTEVRSFPSQADAERREAAQTLLTNWAGCLSARYQRDLRQISLSYYRDGQDSVAFHGDKLGSLRKDTVVAILSVGERRRFLLRPAGSRGASRRSLTFQVGGGDLLVMGGCCQETWEHSVPKARCNGPRIAIMFRESRSFLTRAARPGAHAVPAFR